MRDGLDIAFPVTIVELRTHHPQLQHCKEAVFGVAEVDAADFGNSP